MHRIKNLSRGNFLWTQITTIILDLLRSRSSAGRSFTEAAFQIDGKFRGYHSICYSDNSVVAIVEGRVNGNRLIAAVRVGGRGIQNGATIDSNHVVSPHGKGNAITKLLSDALKKENAGETGVCCIKKRLKICVPVPGCNCPDQLHRMASSIVYSMPVLLSTENM